MAAITTKMSLSISEYDAISTSSRSGLPCKSPVTKFQKEFKLVAGMEINQPVRLPWQQLLNVAVTLLYDVCTERLMCVVMLIDTLAVEIGFLAQERNTFPFEQHSRKVIVPSHSWLEICINSYMKKASISGSYGLRVNIKNTYSKIISLWKQVMLVIGDMEISCFWLEFPDSLSSGWYRVFWVMLLKCGLGRPVSYPSLGQSVIELQVWPIEHNP